MIFISLEYAEVIKTSGSQPFWSQYLILCFKNFFEDLYEILFIWFNYQYLPSWKLKQIQNIY